MNDFVCFCAALSHYRMEPRERERGGDTATSRGNPRRLLGPAEKGAGVQRRNRRLAAETRTPPWTKRSRVPCDEVDRARNKSGHDSSSSKGTMASFRDSNQRPLKPKRYGKRHYSASASVALPMGPAHGWPSRVHLQSTKASYFKGHGLLPGNISLHSPATATAANPLPFLSYLTVAVYIRRRAEGTFPALCTPLLFELQRALITVGPVINRR
ncbi:hypothetical protein SKAU_G00139660 [Synaphobranchus kaupii]|uniref:Uncharacterized protein n=1 Tax=Synaphobranchus kaupii TaxID=118154 RepID=A0A9Q1J4B0_SYNKA|nr:hypothetical protein SKAU_G00139660 [Synaphobranchus kaupii]